jgi:hypothetical protein
LPELSAVPALFAMAVSSSPTCVRSDVNLEALGLALIDELEDRLVAGTVGVG